MSKKTKPEQTKPEQPKPDYLEEILNKSKKYFRARDNFRIFTGEQREHVRPEFERLREEFEEILELYIVDIVTKNSDNIMNALTDTKNDPDIFG